MLTKKQQRQYCLEKRQSISPEARMEYSKIICKTLSESAIFQKAKVIMSYMPSDDEVDPSYLESCDKVFCYPVCINNETMEARIPNPVNGIEIGKYGIKSPKLSNSIIVNKESIDLIIVPCVGFDEKCLRLGHGKGYYDRYLQFFDNSKIISIAFEEQKLDNTIIDKWDIPMSMIITQKNIY